METLKGAVGGFIPTVQQGDDQTSIDDLSISDARWGKSERGRVDI